MNLVRTANGNYFSPDDPGEGTYADRPPRYSVTDEECEILTELAAGRRVLEIGTGLGVSTRALAKSALRVTSIDIDPWCHQEEFPENITLLDRLPEDLSKLDLVFIDGSHHYEDVLRDIRSTAPISPVVMHDVYLDDVARAVEAAGLKLVRQYPTVCKLTVYWR